MLELGLVAFTTYFATIGPPDVAVLFAALAGKQDAAARRRLAIKAVIIAAGILLFFALFGQAVLGHLGISLPALRTAGGILLLLIAIDMVFARPSGAIGTSGEETAEAAHRQDISVFPLATPLIAGPGAIGATILLVAEAHGDTLQIASVVAAMAAVLVITLAMMLVATQVEKILGKTGVHVIARVVGVLLAGLAVQFIFDGVKGAGLVG